MAWWIVALIALALAGTQVLSACFRRAAVSVFMVGAHLAAIGVLYFLGGTTEQILLSLLFSVTVGLGANLFRAKGDKK